MTDFSFSAMEGRLEEFLLLLMLGSMTYFGLAYSRRRGGGWPKVFGWCALAGLLVYALTIGAKFVQVALRAGHPPRETPDLPVSYEMWDLLGGLTTLLFGIAFLTCGVALVYVGWMEGKGSRRSAKRKPKRA